MTIQTYRAFWPYYLDQHRSPLTRAIHFAGAGSFFVLLFVAAALRSGWPILAAFLMFYLPAWVAHFVIEGNRPATWRYPTWSFFSDVRMLGLWLTGGLQAELERHQPISKPLEARADVIGIG